MSLDIDVILRDNAVIGVSGTEHKPIKSQLRQYLKSVSRIAASNAVHVRTLAELQGKTGVADDTGGFVWGDSTDSNNGVYRYDATGSPDGWDRLAGLPHTAAVLTNVSGSANAITADTEVGVDPAEVKILILGDPPGTNTSTTVTIALNSGDAENIKSASGTDLAVGDIVDGVGTLLFRSGSEWRQLVSSSTTATIDYQGVWDSGTTYTLAQFVTSSNKLYYNTSVSSLNEQPGTLSPDPWLLVFDLSTTLEGWAASLSGATSLFVFEGTSGGVIRASGAADSYSLTIGADSTPTTNVSPQFNIYGKGHASWPGEAFFTAVTATITGKSRPGNINLESQVAIRRFLMVGVRTSLTLGSGWDANDVPAADAPLHVFTPTGSLGTDPQITSVGANATYNPTAVFEANVSGGGQASNQYIVGTNGVFHNIHGNPGNSVRWIDTYDHQNGVVKYLSGSNQRFAYNNNDVYIGAKVAQDLTSVGAEFRGDAGQLSITADGTHCLHLNRLTDDGSIATFAQANTTEGSISISGTSVFYNAFHAAHWSQLSDRSKPDIPFGTVCDTIDELCEWRGLEFLDPVTGEKIVTEEFSDKLDLFAFELDSEIEIEVSRTVKIEVEHIRYETKQVLGPEYEVIGYEHEEINGKIVRKKVIKLARDPVIEELPLIDEDGNPIMKDVLNEEGEVISRVPDVVTREKTETVEIKEKTVEDQPRTFKIDAKVVLIDNNRLVKFEISKKAGSRRVYGTFVGWDKPNTPFDVDASISCLGAGFCRIDKNVTVKGGDLLESAGNGCARLHRPGRGSPMGKVNANIRVMTHDDGSYVVPMEHVRS